MPTPETLRNKRAWMSCFLLAVTTSAASANEIKSHPPLRTPPPPNNRPLPDGPIRYVDSARGDDANDGNRDTPWKTINHAIEQAKAGDTICLRGGTYYENVQVRLLATADAPLTIRSFPGEQAVINGGLREFFDDPAASWEPCPDGAAGEYRSTRTYPNLRHVLGAFGDSMIGLVAYYHAKDLRATGEFFELDETTQDFVPLYCGPGIWYDPATGHIHARLAATHVPGGENYAGATDPRALSLVIAPFRSVPLHIDGARYVRFQDLTIRGGGYDTVVLDQCSDIEFDNVTVWCGTYGLRATGAQRLRFHRGALHGSIPPWLTRPETGLQSYPGRPQRDIARLNTHALLVAEAGREFSVHAFPFNDNWEVAYSEFTDASDGLYLADVNLDFHHNLIDRMQDDGVYLSPMYPRYEKLTGQATLHLHQNIFRRALTKLAFGGPEPHNNAAIYFYRNIIDLREPVNHARATSKAPGPVEPYAGHVMGDHGSPPWPSLFAYHNTIVSRQAGRAADFLFTTGATEDRPRRAFNNIYVHGASLGPFAAPASAFIQTDGNLYWQPDAAASLTEAFFAPYRASAAFADSKSVYPPGFDVASQFGDPRFERFAFDAAADNDYRLQPGSPAIDRGVSVPSDWPDPLRESDAGAPDIGALPYGPGTLHVGRNGATR
jgi:hypothetical protein